MNQVIISWPPTMHYRGEEIKRCLGNADMDNRTLRDRLLKYGFGPEIEQINTAELLQAISEEQQKTKTVPNFSKYEAIQETTDNYLK